MKFNNNKVFFNKAYIYLLGLKIIQYFMYYQQREKTIEIEKVTGTTGSHLKCTYLNLKENTWYTLLST